MYFDAYISDLHFYHNNIIKYCDRPYEDIFEMNEKLIENYNKKIRSCDTVLWLGDCFFTKDRERHKIILSRLNGRKFLLRGNHDDKITDLQFYYSGFSGIFNTHFLGEIGKYIVRYSHYPHYELTGDQRYRDRRPPVELGVTLIHGHTHEKIKVTAKNHIHVGVDAWDYSPALYDEVLDLLKQIEIGNNHE